jgi:hypothetical protein
MPARDRGGMFSINNPDDGSPIREMFTLGESLIFITEKCTYRMQLADQIDPSRSNPALPHNVQQKLFDHGIHSELLRDTFLLSKIMFRKECQPKLDIERAKQLGFDALCELVSMQESAQTFVDAEKAAITKASATTGNEPSLAIPSVGNVKAHCKTFIQKADHFAVALLSIVRLFYPEQKGMNWDDFHALVATKYGEADNFFKVTELTVPRLKLVRNARDCLEHHNKGVDIIDFHLQADGAIGSPSIAIDFRKSVQEQCHVSWFMVETAKALRNSFEMIVTHTCAKNLEPFAGMPISVGVLDENYQKAWGVRFAYGMYDANGRFSPMG